MELLQGERILWQGRPSWRAQLSFFVIWIPVALLPVIIAGIVRANDGDTGLAATPMGSFEIGKLACDGGLVVTASNSPR